MTKPAGPLPAQERACMLRAIRAYRADRQHELDRLIEHAQPEDKVGHAQRDAMRAEIDCLTRGVDWLWQTQP